MKNIILTCVERVPSRLVIALMIFSVSCVNYMMRVNLSINLVVMVPLTNHTTSDSQASLNWTAYERAQVLGSFFWGYLIGSGVCGPFIQQFGPKRTMMLTALISGALTLLSPVAAKHSYIAMMILRMALGFFCGTSFPTMHALISRWAVAVERGRFLGMLIGGAIGTFFAWTICGFIIEPFGWEWGFYVFGITSLLWLCLIWYCVYDNPEKHPRISAKELHYIQKGLSAVEEKKVKKIPPYSKILLAVPSWSLAAINFGNGWGIYFVITAAPNYLASVLGYTTSSTGILSGLIYLIRSTCALGFGYLGDYVLERKLISLKVYRKVACVLSHIVPGCIVLCMAIPGHKPLFYVALIITAMSLNGFVTASSAANGHDLTKSYVATLTGLAGAFTTLAGIVSPFVTAFFTKDDETNGELWRPVFYTGGVIYIVTGLQFLLLGSTEIQPWEDSGTLSEKNQNYKVSETKQVPSHIPNAQIK